MQAESGQKIEQSIYGDYLIKVRIDGPHDKMTGEGFTVMIKISKGIKVLRDWWIDSDFTHKTYAAALSFGITIARQELDKIY
jgi:hypothetical protein